MGIFNMERSIAPWFTFIIAAMSEQRLKWDRSEVSRLRELYLNSPGIPIPSLTKAYNLKAPRHRTKNAVKCQLRMIRAELEIGIPSFATSATSAALSAPVARSLLNEQADASCQICHDRSTWNILHEGYRRIEAAHHYALKCERELKQCQDALTASAAEVNEERLDHRATQEALGFEQALHKETIKVLERVFEEARVSGELADYLRRQVASLQRPPSAQIVQVPPRAVLELEGSTPTQNNLALLEASEAKSTTGSRSSPGPINIAENSMQTRFTKFPGHESLGDILLQ
ncbi:hypothetical protein V492_00245 [Pseudogymnoascus sp. VKM F-4246]|nr:hypothetical protein V492_00245 [Pseudogymnoascus sp. VKM F-4246]